LNYHSIEREGKIPKFFLIPKDPGIETRSFESHWDAKRFAKKHKIKGHICKELGYFED
jgi:hypothetical protein